MLTISPCKVLPSFLKLICPSTVTSGYFYLLRPPLQHQTKQSLLVKKNKQNLLWL